MASVSPLWLGNILIGTGGSGGSGGIQQNQLNQLAAAGNQLGALTGGYQFNGNTFRQFTAVQPSPMIKIITCVREKLQSETDAWLKDVFV